MDGTATRSKHQNVLLDASGFSDGGSAFSFADAWYKPLHQQVLSSFNAQPQAPARLGFIEQLNVLTSRYQSDDQQLDIIIDRCQKAITYFSAQINQDILQPIEAHYKKWRLKSGINRYLSFLEQLLDFLDGEGKNMILKQREENEKKKQDVEKKRESERW